MRVMRTRLAIATAILIAASTGPPAQAESFALEQSLQSRNGSQKLVVLPSQAPTIEVVGYTITKRDVDTAFATATGTSHSFEQIPALPPPTLAQPPTFIERSGFAPYDDKREKDEMLLQTDANQAIHPGVTYAMLERRCRGLNASDATVSHTDTV